MPIRKFDYLASIRLSSTRLPLGRFFHAFRGRFSRCCLLSLRMMRHYLSEAQSKLYVLRRSGILTCVAR